MAQRPRHVLVHPVVLGVEDVARGAPRVVGEAWGGRGGSAPRAQATGKGLGCPAGSSLPASQDPSGAPLTVDAQHPLLLVFRARLKLLDEVPATLQCHTRHLGHEPGACHCATVPAAPTACSDTPQVRPLGHLHRPAPA